MNDLHVARKYAAVTSELYANRLADRLITRTTILESFPEAGRMVPEFSNALLRELPERNHWIIYLIISDIRIELFGCIQLLCPYRT